MTQQHIQLSRVALDRVQCSGQIERGTKVGEALQRGEANEAVARADVEIDVWQGSEILKGVHLRHQLQEESQLADLDRLFHFFSRRRRHTSFSRDWSSDVCSSD